MTADILKRDVTEIPTVRTNGLRCLAIACGVSYNRTMTCAPPATQDVTDAISSCLRAKQSARIEEVANELHVSRSTLQRALSRSGTTFTRLRQVVQLEEAARHLMYPHRSYSRSHLASRLGLSREYMSRRLQAEWNLSPADIERLSQLRSELVVTNSLLGRLNSEPNIGVEDTPWLTERRKHIETEIRDILAHIPSNSPSRWADQIRSGLRTSVSPPPPARRNERVLTNQL